ncbi:hypothetical protein Y032_0317g2316 [Ancylostoma ceylanicum]|uniref:dTMP kinase n=2 Tax=Ancylostoma ceylanicum TaxID=53326 RepID=A0A016S2B6_9BILA|nr:hypothetical protein Y032_0317g2316 [Ancylostoma ceylanicum]
MVRRGALIVFEGLDRSGKSTQAKRLMDKINASGGRAVILPFPDRKEPFGQVIDRYLRKEIDLCERALHLAFSANRWEKAALIEEKIAAGVDVICDRYCFSGVAYSIAKEVHPEVAAESNKLGRPKQCGFSWEGNRRAAPSDSINSEGKGVNKSIVVIDVANEKQYFWCP